jgi:hypothetical protein
MASSYEKQAEVRLEWLIPQRSRIQISASELLSLLQDNIDKFPKNPDLEEVAGLMTGAAFSLWRAVFLAPERPTGTKDMIGTGIQFLDKFLRDNSISYSDEKKRRDWSFGYYLNSARFRLRYAKDIQSKKEGYPYGWEGYEWLTVTHQAGTDVEEEWEKHIKVFEQELREFRRLLSL